MSALKNETKAPESTDYHKGYVAGYKDGYLAGANSILKVIEEAAQEKKNDRLN